MDHMWAPWRMEYIEQSEPAPDCLFCALFRSDNDEQNHVVYRRDHAFVVLNRYPYNSGHLMVVPDQHAGSVYRLDPSVATDMVAVSQLAVRVLEEVMQPHGFNLGINQGKVAGAGIEDHIHMHVVPRWNGDTNFMPVLAETKVLPEMLTTTAAKLRPVFARLAPDHPVGPSP
jgi:ATP adenylyltransferase